MNARIIELERLIPELESVLERTPRKEIETYAQLESQIDQYRLEYVERTGKSYEAPHVHDILRWHGAGA